MVVAREEQINDVLDERVGSVRIFSEAITSYIKVSNEISALQLELINNKAPQKTVIELEKLKRNLENKHSIAKTEIEHSKLSLENLKTSIDELKQYYSPENLSKKKEDLLKGLLLTNRRIDELTKKKKEIIAVNKVIADFPSVQDFKFTSEELEHVFGDKAELFKKAPRVSKRTSYVTETKRVSKTEIEGNKDKDGDVELKDVDTTEQQEQKQEMVEVKERKEITTYSFRANIRNSVPELKKLQSELQQSIQQYEKEIDDIKQGYIANVRKFEAIKRIVESDSTDLPLLQSISQPETQAT